MLNWASLFSRVRPTFSSDFPVPEEDGGGVRRAHQTGSCPPPRAPPPPPPPTWAVGHGRAHVHEAQGAAGERLPAAGAAGDLGLGGGAADAVLAEAAALVGNTRRAAVGDGLPTEVTAHKHLPGQERSEVSRGGGGQGQGQRSEVRGASPGPGAWSWGPASPGGCQTPPACARTSRRPGGCGSFRSNTGHEGL